MKDLKFNLLTFHSNPLTKSCHSDEQIQDSECAAIRKNSYRNNWIASSDLRPPRNDRGINQRKELIHLITYSPIHFNNIRNGQFTTYDSQFTHRPPSAGRGGKKVAFTLAEVLITIGIIGVVSAITIPNLMHKYYEKQTVAKLKETYSIMSQAVRLAEQEYGEVPSWGLKLDKSSDDAKILGEKLKPFLKIADDCGIDDYNFRCAQNVQYKLLSEYNTYNYASNKVYYKLSLLNGVSIFMCTKEPGDTRDFSVLIDTNGKNLPNTWGKDLFQFLYDADSGLKPSGAPNTDRPYTTYCTGKNSTGYGCAYYVLQNENMDYLKK